MSLTSTLHTPLTGHRVRPQVVHLPPARPPHLHTSHTLHTPQVTLCGRKLITSRLRVPASGGGGGAAGMGMGNAFRTGGGQGYAGAGAGAAGGQSPSASAPIGMSQAKKKQLGFWRQQVGWRCDGLL